MLGRPVVEARASHLWHRLRTPQVVFVVGVVIYLFLAIGIFWPRVPWSSSTLPSGSDGRGFGDPQQTVWFLAWIPYALGHGLNIFHSNYLDFPHGVDLANTTSVPLLGLAASPITLSLGPVAAFNVLLRVAFASSASSMFFALRSWCRTPAAFVGGLVYGFGPYMVIQGENHLDLIFVPLPPLIVWCLYRLLFTQPQDSKRLGLLLGALCGAQALIDPELLAMLGIVLFLGCLGLALTQGSRTVSHFKELAKALPPALLVFLVVSGYYIWSLLFAAGHLVGPVYPTHVLQQIRSDILETIVPTTHQFVAPLALATTAYRFVGGNYTENAGYLSVTFVLLFTYFTFRRRMNTIVVFSACLAIVAFVLSLGASLELDGHPTSLPLPETVLTRVALFRNFTPARFSLFVALFAIIAVSIGLDFFLSDVAHHRFANLYTRLHDMVVVALGIVTVALMFPLLPLSTATLPWSSDVTSTLATIPSGTVVLGYPLPLAQWTESMVWQAEDEMRFRLIGGYITNQASSTYGSPNPQLLTPKVVEQSFIQAQAGPNVRAPYAPYYQQPRPTIDVRSSLCAFLTRQHVGAVVFWKGGPYGGVYPSRIYRLFHAALGVPTHVARNNTLSIWLTKKSGCAP